MMRFLRRFRRAAGEYFFSGGGAEYTEAPVSGERRRCLFFRHLHFPRKYSFTPCSASPQGTNEGNFREIIVVQTGNVLLVRAGDCLLRLHDLNRIGDARTKAIARLCERLIRQIDIAASQPSPALPKTAG